MAAPDRITITHQRPMTSPNILAALNTFQQAANRGTAVYLSPGLVQGLRDALRAEPEPEGEGPTLDHVNLIGFALGREPWATWLRKGGCLESAHCELSDLMLAAITRWGVPAAPPTPETPAEALAARPLLEQVAAMADCIGANTVGQITAISSRAAAWLRENPPGQPVAIEPRGCPTPGACSCVELAPPAPEPGELGELVELLKLAGRWATSTGVHLDRFAALFDHQEAELAALRGVPVAVEALTRLYWWGGMSGAYGYSADVVLGVRDWINSGMVGGLPPLPAWIADRCPPLPAPQAGEGEA